MREYYGVYPPKCYTLFYMRRTLTAIRIEQPLLDKLGKIAQSEDRSVSYIIREAIREFLKRRETRGKKEGK
jgi:predicted transcriptional regulator